MALDDGEGAVADGSLDESVNRSTASSSVAVARAVENDGPRDP
jgi:hypothetical protein